MKKLFTPANLYLLIAFFVVLAVAESAGFGPGATAAKIRAKF